MAIIFDRIWGKASQQMQIENVVEERTISEEELRELAQLQQV